MAGEVPMETSRETQERSVDAVDNFIRLSVPWLAELGYNDVRFTSYDYAREFVRERSKLHALYIREAEITRRVGLCFAAFLLLAACVMPVFAPQGREVISWWISAALFVFSAGAVGFSHIWVKTKHRHLKLERK